ncbi:TetR/AcrR family transcriptional regulator [Inquilinus limosus]|uniref:TetR/AcrR family transcriptional regulator n=1 Tax=Inquilinus limosus TaxID=171674 RepID=UPI000423E038|nr:TetR/AcrR family transcriptional regulator [Inquilinus limosus]
MVHISAMVPYPGRPREFDKDAALDAAMALFWHQGYEATSLDDLTRAMDLSRSSFYGCFGSKRDTLVAAIRRYGDQRFAELERRVEAEPDAGRALRIAVDAIANVGGGRDGCFLINCAVELAPHDPEIEGLGRHHLERLEALLARLLARRPGAAEAGAATARARSLLALAVGASVMHKAGTAPAAIDELLAAAEPLMR